jgi:hypothetical protein
MPHTACIVAGVVTVAFVGVATWLVRRSHRATTDALRFAAQSLEQASLARAQLAQAQQARRPLPDVIRSVALSYAAKAKN